VGDQLVTIHRRSGGGAEFVALDGQAGYEMGLFDAETADHRRRFMGAADGRGARFGARRRAQWA
jgi:hypothetical protein